MHPVFSASFLLRYLVDEVRKNMQELLAKMVGKKLDIMCGGTAHLRGKAVKVDSSVLHLVGEDDQVFYVAIEKIVVFNEVRANDQRAGFISGVQK